MKRLVTSLCCGALLAFNACAPRVFYNGPSADTFAGSFQAPRGPGQSLVVYTDADGARVVVDQNGGAADNTRNVNFLAPFHWLR